MNGTSDGTSSVDRNSGSDGVSGARGIRGRVRGAGIASDRLSWAGHWDGSVGVHDRGVGRGATEMKVAARIEL